MGEQDQEQRRKDYIKVLELTEKDPLFFRVNRRQIEYQFKRIIERRKKDFEERSNDSREIKEFMRSTPGDIYILPLYKEFEKNCSSDRESIVLESQFAHEIFHREQEKRGLNKKFPYAVEGPAWALQYLYGAKEIGIKYYSESFNELVKKLTGSEDIEMSKRELGSYNHTLTSLNTVQRFVGFNIYDNPQDLLEKFKSVFDRPRYDKISLAIIYQHFREELKELLDVKE